jgi:hypothetical protein
LKAGDEEGLFCSGCRGVKGLSDVWGLLGERTAEDCSSSKPSKAIKRVVTITNPERAATLRISEVLAEVLGLLEARMS